MVRCEECNRNKIETETKGKIYECPECGMTVCESCKAKLLGNCQFCAPPFKEVKVRKKLQAKR